MSAQEFRALLRLLSFQPFRIVLSTGAVYEIPHPELVIIQRTTAWLHLSVLDRMPGLGVRRTLISLLHIVQIELLRI